MNAKIFFTIFLVLLVCGCTQKNTTKVTPTTGTLTQNGKPLANVRIEFKKMDSGATSFAVTDEQGRFTLRHSHGQPGAEPGTYRVSVWRKGKPIPTSPNAPEEGIDPMTPEEPILMSDKSPIEIVVTERQDSNVFDIDIK